jgi:hypothetical protein
MSMPIEYMREWREKHKKKCRDCQKPIYFNAIRCQECYWKSMKESRKAENNPMWKGDNVDKGGSLHEWVGNRIPKPQFCENCKQRPPYDLANKSGLYKRDLSDWEWLCRKCHMESDGRLYTFNINAPRKGRPLAPPSYDERINRKRFLLREWRKRKNGFYKEIPKSLNEK